jgi:5-methylcytosine-specific restriction protein A
MNASQYRKQQNRQRGECTWCGKPVAKGRRLWCSDACVEAYRSAYDWPHIRALVRARDHGVCARCGHDTEKLSRILSGLRTYIAWCHMKEIVSVLGASPDYYRHAWEAHHKVARKECGDNSLDNLETLCLECHKRETAQQRRRWKATPN